jgi:hypothetical protein
MIVGAEFTNRGNEPMLPKTCRVLVAGLLSTAMAANPCIAATVSNEGGAVLVSMGEGFEPISSSKELPPGGRVMVKPDGLATIAYSANCSVRVGSGLWTVQEKAPCREGNAVLDFTGRMNDGLNPKVIPAEEPPPQVYRDHLILGALAAGAIVACVVWWCRGHHHHHASPGHPAD